MGRDEALNDAPVRQEALHAYKIAGGSMHAFLTSLLTSDAFLYRTTSLPQQACKLPMPSDMPHLRAPSFLTRTYQHLRCFQKNGFRIGANSQVMRLVCPSVGHLWSRDAKAFAVQRGITFGISGQF